MTTAMTTVDAKEKFVELINHIIHTKERIVLTRRGKEVAAIVPLEDLQLLEFKRDKDDLDEAINAFKQAKMGDSITLEKLKEELGF